MPHRGQLFCSLILSFCLFASAAGLQAQGYNPNEDINFFSDEAAWHVIFGFNYLGVDVDAVAQSRDGDIPVDISLGDVFDRLFSGSLRLEARRRRLNFAVELSHSKQNRGEQNGTDYQAAADTTGIGLRFRTSRIDGFVSYRLGAPETAFEILAGLRYSDWYVEGETRRNGTVLGRGQFEQNGWEPIVGLRFTGELARRLVFITSGIAGGFGRGSQHSYDIHVGFGYGLTRFTYIFLQYRWFDQVFESGSASSFRRYDGREHGLVFGFVFII
jgi:hypothetical protein